MDGRNQNSPHIINHTLDFFHLIYNQIYRFQKLNEMKKNLNLSISTNQVITEDNYQEILLEIIYDVIGKRKLIHSKYDELIKKLWGSSKPITLKTNLGKYLLTRLLRESDRAFEEAQSLAKQLCPNCKKDFSNNDDNYSEKLH